MNGPFHWGELFHPTCRGYFTLCIIGWSLWKDNSFESNSFQTADCTGCCCTCPELSALHLFHQSYCLVNCRRLVLTLWDSPHFLQINQNKQNLPTSTSTRFCSKTFQPSICGCCKERLLCNITKTSLIKTSFQTPQVSVMTSNIPKKKKEMTNHLPKPGEKKTSKNFNPTV